MIKKLASTLPTLVHSIFSKLNNNNDDNNNNHEHAGAPSSSHSSDHQRPQPSSKQIKNPFFVTRDYLDHTLEAICSKAGINIPAHVYHALIECLVANDHLIIDSSYIGGSAHVSGFALLNILPYLVGLRCSYVMCTASTTPQEIFRKLVDPLAQSYPHCFYFKGGDSDMEFTPSNLVASAHAAINPSSSSSSSARHRNNSTTTPPSPSPATIHHKSSRSLNTNDTTQIRYQLNKHRRNSSRLRPISGSLTEDVMQLALSSNLNASQASLPRHSPSDRERDKERERERERGQAIHAQVLVVDNMIAAPPHTLSALYQVMKSRQVPYKGYKYNTPSVFIVIGISGKKKPPVISNSPFLMNIPLFDPLVTTNPTEPPSLALTEEEILLARNAVPSIYIAQDMHQYMRNIVMSLRNHPSVDIGPDTRVVSALENAARSAAVTSGQKFVTPPHILSIAGQVLNHRLSLVPLNPSSSSNPLLNHFTSPSFSFVPATSRFMALVHNGRNRSKKDMNNINSYNEEDNDEEDSANHSHHSYQSNRSNRSTTKLPDITTTTTTTTTTTNNNNNNYSLANAAGNNNSNNSLSATITPPPTLQNLNSTYIYPNFPAPSSAEIFMDSFEVIESLLNQLDVPV